MHRRTLLPFLLLLVVGASSGASIYRWVDEKGVTHFSETPPAGRKAESIDLGASPPADGQPTRPPARTWQEKEVEFQRRQIERREVQEAEEKKAKARKARCLDLRDELALDERFASRYSVDPTGQRILWSDERRAARRAALRQEIAITCDGK